MATYRGQDGSVKISTNTVGGISAWETTIAVDALETTVLGLQWRTYRSGLGGGTGRLTAFFDYGDTNGQKVLTDALVAATPGGTVATVHLVISSTKTIDGDIIVESVQLNTPLGQLITAAFAFRWNGQPAITWS